MSIIADTLKRLQARSTATIPEIAEEPSLRPRFNQAEGTGRHRKHSYIRFWMIGVGITIGFGGLALSAFWIGWHLDFGFSANTHARVANSHSMPQPPIPSAIQITTPIPSETSAAVIPEPIQASPTPAPETKREDIKERLSVSTDNSPNETTSVPQILAKSQPVVSPTESAALSQRPDQKVKNASADLAKTDHERIMPNHPSSDEFVTPLTETDRLTSHAEQPYPEIPISEETQELKEIHPVAAPLEEEIVLAEEFAKTDISSTKPPTHSTRHLPLSQARLESERPTGIPSQPSPSNRLRHAQQLIQSGEYEEAVALLSPLFHDPPVKWQPWFWMGTALLGKGDMEQADQFFLSGLARNDKVPQLWIQRALVAQQRGDYQLAIHELRQAESLEAGIPHIHLNMGYAYEQLGNDRLANQYYGKFLKLSEGKPAFFSTRKKLFARLTQQTTAETLLPPSPTTSPQP